MRRHLRTRTLTRGVATLFAAGFALVAVSQEAPLAQADAGEYEAVVPELFGAFLAPGAIQVTCAEKFPDTRAANEAALSQWLKSQDKTISEVNRHALALILHNAEGDAKQAKKVEDQHRSDTQGMIRRELTAGDPAAFEKLCRTFPDIFKQPAWADLEKQYAPALALIRAKAPAELKGK